MTRWHPSRTAVSYCEFIQQEKNFKHGYYAAHECAPYRTSTCDLRSDRAWHCACDVASTQRGSPSQDHWPSLGLGDGADGNQVIRHYGYPADRPV